MGLGQYDSIGEYCGPHTASSVFPILIHGAPATKIEGPKTLVSCMPNSCTLPLSCALISDPINPQIKSVRLAALICCSAHAQLLHSGLNLLILGHLLTMFHIRGGGVLFTEDKISKKT